MRKFIFVSLLVSLSVLLAACGSAATTPAETTSSKQVNIKVETNPTPAMKGDIELMFTITDASGEPIEGAKVDVAADHPAMAGMGMSGLATEHRLHLLPATCPSCGGPTRGHEVKWTGPQSADCPYCGINLPMKKS